MVRGKIAGNAGKTINVAFRNRLGERDPVADLDVEVRQDLAFADINDTRLV